MRKLLLVALIAYVGSYGAFRQSNSEIWDKDKKTYVIFPESMPWLYYAWRPLTYLDGTMTGINFHIGPHK
jgi:hypothetical protein